MIYYVIQVKLIAKEMENIYFKLKTVMAEHLKVRVHLIKKIYSCLLPIQPK